MKKRFIPKLAATAAAVLAIGSTGLAAAGTPNLNLSGKVASTKLYVRTTPAGAVQGTYCSPVNWTWNLTGGNGTVTASDGCLNPTGGGSSIYYEIWSDSSMTSKDLTVTHISGGLYHVDYYFVIHYPGGDRQFSTWNCLDLTLSGTNLTVFTPDCDSSGVYGRVIPANASNPPLPFGAIEQEWVSP